MMMMMMMMMMMLMMMMMMLLLLLLLLALVEGTQPLPAPSFLPLQHIERICSVIR